MKILIGQAKQPTPHLFSHSLVLIHRKFTISSQILKIKVQKYSPQEKPNENNNGKSVGLVVGIIMLVIAVVAMTFLFGFVIDEKYFKTQKENENSQPNQTEVPTNQKKMILIK